MTMLAYPFKKVRLISWGKFCWIRFLRSKVRWKFFLSSSDLPLDCWWFIFHYYRKVKNRGLLHYLNLIFIYHSSILKNLNKSTSRLILCFFRDILLKARRRRGSICTCRFCYRIGLWLICSKTEMFQVYVTLV